MNTSKVILVQPPIEDFYLTKKRTIPYGLASVAACVKEQGFDVEIIDALATNKSKTIEYPEDFSYLKTYYNKKDTSFFSLFHEFKHFGYSYEYIGTKIRDKKPFVVGISSLFTAYFDAALKTAQIIKKFYPYCKIILGGHHPTVFPEKVLKFDAIDFVLRGEGETSMDKLCCALKRNRDLKEVPGIAFKENNSFFVSKPSWIKNFKGLPIPATDLINHNFYKRKNRDSTIIVSSRGCPMQCSYCSVSASSAYAPFRQREVKDVIKEILYQKKTRDIGFIDFEDENLCLNKQWFLSLFSQLKNIFTGMDIELRAMNGLYPPSIDEEIVSLMKASGFKTLNLSLGSTSKDQLKKFKRRDVRASFENSLILARKHNLECVSYIIAAAPGQTAKNSLEDLLYLAEKRTLVGLSIFYPAPGSLDYKLCQDKRILPGKFCLMRSTALPINDTTSRLEAITLLRLSRILNFMKHLMDTRGSIPGSQIFPGLKTSPALDRQNLSQKLLQWFLHDGKIRGIHPKEGFYTHVTDKNLTQEFIKRIKNIKVSGMK
ncbi:MAG: B12-binding domain-containing radical SAM protein [Deltaproteobacteria bacterium]|nr:B12-binding domain-containing radical SAM protein [Deltaproteobacteria bacterium]